MKSCAAGAGHEQTLLLLMLTVLGTLATLALLCGVVGLFPLDVPSQADIAGIIQIFPDQVIPEPVERRMFLLSVVTLPFNITGWYLLWRMLLRRLSPRVLHRVFLWAASGTLLGLLFYLLKIRAEAEFFIRNAAAGGAWCAVCGLAAAGLCYMLYRSGRQHLFPTDIILSCCSAALLTVIFLYSLYDISIVSDDNMYTFHFNAIFHAMVQVFLGKELLVDFVHQYGLYPHFLEPLFRLIGLEVLSFTIIIGILTVLTFLLLLRTMLLVTDSRTIALLGFLALVSGGYVGKIVSSYDPYFQYFPLRTIFPAAAAWLVVGYLRTRSTLHFAALYMVSSLAILWNPETGIVVMTAVLLTTLYDEYSRHNLRSGLLLLCKGALISIAAIAAFSCYLYLRYGEFPDYRELARYTAIFYGTGFFMLPMTPLHPWNLVVLVYIAGLAWGIGALVSGVVTQRTSVVTFLSLLGIGLFAYYQGRSHNEVLLLCLYPAFMLLTVFIDRLLVRGTENRVAMAAGICGVTFLVFTAGGLYNGAVRLVFGELGIVNRYNDYRHNSQPNVMNRAEFIRNRTARGEEVLILSGHSGLFHLVSQTTNPVEIPSIPEAVLVEDYQKILACVDQGPCRRLFVDTVGLVYSQPGYQRLRDILSERYAPYEFTPDWKLAMFVKVR